jgi:MFS family permease
MTHASATVQNGSIDSPGLLDRERIVAKPGFNRWLVPPAALCIHLCIGMAYGFSVFWKPLEGALTSADGSQVIASCSAGATTFAEKGAGTLRALFATDCNWSQFGLGWMYTFFFVMLGLSAATWGGWLERAGPRKAGVVSAMCWCGGLLISALGAHSHQLWLMWLGSGLIGGIGLGLGYISPVSTLIKWFPDRRGMATGMAIMGFGGGAMIGSPLATLLMNFFKTPTDPGVWQTFIAMAAIYFVFMLIGAFGYRLPPLEWRPEGWTPPSDNNAMITSRTVHLRNAHKTPQFWCLWLVLCLNVSAGIGIIGAASPMLQETFGGVLVGEPQIGFDQFDGEETMVAAAVGAGFVGLISLFNIFGRIAWASFSDKVGRKRTYAIFFTLGAAMYAVASFAADWKAVALFVAAFCIIASMYGGGFATIPAYLADMFGTQFVAAIHGRLLTAWSTAGILGPVVVNYLHDKRLAEQLPADQIYGPIFYILGGMLVLGGIANLLVRPVNPKWYMSDAEVTAVQAKLRSVAATAQTGSFGIGKGGLDVKAALFWLLVGIPLVWGVWNTVEKTLVLLR